MSGAVVALGDVFRVTDPSRFKASFGSRIKDRDAIVVSGPFVRFGSWSVMVEFQKRNGRGSTFREIIRLSELTRVEAA